MFLDSLQGFLLDLSLVDVSEGEYVFDGKSYDRMTFYTLFLENPSNDFEVEKIPLKDFSNGEVVRYSKDDLEMLIIFLKEKIKLVFYCDPEKKETVVQALLKFCRIG